MDQFDNTPNFPGIQNSTNSAQFFNEFNSFDNEISLNRKNDDEKSRKGILKNSVSIIIFSDSLSILRKITFNEDILFTCENPDHVSCFHQKNIFNRINFNH